MNWIRKFQAVAVVLSLALVAGACGGGDSTSDTTTTTTTTTSGGGGSDTTTTTAAEPASGDSGSMYCDRVREAEESDESPLDFSFFGKSPEELKAQFEANLEIFDEWRSIAPPEIEADANVVYEAYRTFVERGNDLGWDLQAMADDEVFNTGFDNPALDAASVNLDNHARDVCGVDFATADPGTGAPPGGDDVGDDPIAIALAAFQLPADLFSEADLECMREEVGEEFEAKITADWVPSQEDITVLLAAVDSCGLSLSP